MLTRRLLRLPTAVNTIRTIGTYHSSSSSTSTSVSAKLCPFSVTSAASSSLIPHTRSFSAAAATPTTTPSKKSSKKSDAAATAASTEPELIIGAQGYQYDEFNIIPPIPKPSYEELVKECLTEEQLRFAKRPMVESEHRKEILPSVYVGSKPISQHTNEDLGKYYTLDNKVFDLMPQQIHRTMSQEYMGGGRYHMIRNPGLQMVQALKMIEKGGDDAKQIKQRVFAIRGESGCGKSAALHYVTQFVRERQLAGKPWLLIPARADEFTTETKGFIAPSTVKPGVYDQALYTMEYFKNLLKSESENLKKIKLKRHIMYKTLEWPSNYTQGSEDKTLFDLVTLASENRALAPRLLYDFTAELKRETEIPVLVVIDNMNMWDQVCEFIEPETYVKMDPRKLALVDAFSWFTKKPPSNGASLWALTTRHATLAEAHRHFQYRDVQGFDTWWYSATELRTCIVHYSVSEFILSEVNLDLVVRVSGLTGKVPRDVFKQAFLR